MLLTRIHALIFPPSCNLKHRQCFAPSPTLAIDGPNTMLMIPQAELASTSVLRLRNEGLGMPAAVVLYSPMADVSTPGDSFTTLAHAEPMYLLDLHIRSALDSYAAPKDQKNPYVSAVYGDYAKGYPPTLIQVGTKELILSGPVRLYQAMDSAGVNVKLDVYEAMPHVFQAIPGVPEAEIALGKVNKFLKQHLGE